MTYLLPPGFERRNSSGDIAGYDSLSRESSYDECSVDSRIDLPDTLHSGDFHANGLCAFPSKTAVCSTIPDTAVSLATDDLSLVVSNDLSFVSESSTTKKHSIPRLNIPVN